MVDDGSAGDASAELHLGLRAQVPPASFSKQRYLVSPPSRLPEREVALRARKHTIANIHQFNARPLAVVLSIGSMYASR
jgi:hypothetical protein